MGFVRGWGDGARYRQNFLVIPVIGAGRLTSHGPTLGIMRSDRRPISPCSGISVGISVDVVSLGPVISSASPFSTSIITRFLPRYNKRLKHRTLLSFLNRYTHTRVYIR